MCDSNICRHYWSGMPSSAIATYAGTSTASELRELLKECLWYATWYGMVHGMAWYLPRALLKECGLPLCLFLLLLLLDHMLPLYLRLASLVQLLLAPQVTHLNTSYGVVYPVAHLD